MDQPANKRERISAADIQWQSNTPISQQYGDVYFSRDDGVAETEYVFLQQNRLLERWSASSDTSLDSSFTIAETGFGTGLNFLCAAQLWKQSNNNYKHLHYVSVEKYPVTKQDLTTACNQHPQFNWLSDELLRQYPALIAGTHRLYFAKANITLTLLFGDAIHCFDSLQGLVDAWFLDGFAPAKNPDMWQPELFLQMARLSHPQTTFATFTAAGIVKRGLQQAGFDVKKVSGFGRKREMLRGTIENKSPQPNELHHQDKPWFQYGYKKRCAGKLAVIGGGLAGCTAARSLAQRGWQVDVYEQKSQIATQGSGNPSGITFVKPSLHDNAQNRYYQSAYLNSCRFIRNLFSQQQVEEGDGWRLNGVIRLAYNQVEQKEQQALIENQVWPEELLQAFTAEQLQQQYGLDTPHNGILLKGGGWLSPQGYCQQLLKHPKISVKTNSSVSTLHSIQSETDAPRWVINNSSELYDAVILASAFHCNQFEFSQHLPLRSIRGQITYLPATEQSQQHQHAVNYDGYINPAYNGFHCVGATFTPKFNEAIVLEQDHQWNCQQLENALPEMAQQLNIKNIPSHKGRVGFRCQTPDYLPVVGPMPNPDQFLRDYAPLAKGFLRKPFAIENALPGLFITAGHGSRGITSTYLAAEILASYLCGEPQPIDDEVLHAIHPARFLIRDIVRRKY